MDVRFSDADLTFRDEVREFLDEAWDDELRDMIGTGGSKQFRKGYDEWQRRINRRGWMAPGWPVEYGGVDWSVTQSLIFNTERAMTGAPDRIPFGVVMLAPVLINYGSEEQKARFLPRILNSDDWWCQGYSEPGAGSDLAALQTRAERTAGGYVVNGSKIWTTYAQYADWIFCLVRTESGARKQEGISFLLIDMKSPGVSVRPINTLDGYHHLNEVFFEDVHVPFENLVGEEGKGWTYAKSLLVHERFSIAEVAESGRLLGQLREFARLEVNGGKSLLDDPIFAKRLTDIEIDLMALEYTELRVMAAVAEGAHPGPESSLLKLQGTDIQQALHELHMDLTGYYGGALQGNLGPDEFGHDHVDAARKLYFRGRAATIYGGSSEVQKNITARHVLGL